jgi:HK97 family phage major capsid protein
MSKTEEFLKNIDKGFYRDARAKGITCGQALVQEIQPEEPEVEKVYTRLLRRYKAQDDGSYRARRIRDFAAETCALQKCLEVRGIRTRGAHSDRGEKFFASEQDTALFPSFISNQVIAGAMDVGLVDRLAAMEERVTSHSVESIRLQDTADDRTLKFTGEGANMPKTKIQKAEGIVKLYKYGRVLEWTYEAARLSPINLISTFLMRVGRQIAIDETDDLIEVLIAGDGTTGSNIDDTNDLDAEVSGTTDYDELIRIMMQFPAGYQMTDAIVGDTLLRTVLNLSEVKDPEVDYKVLENGLQAINMMGGMWHRWRSTGAPSFASDNILALDNRTAVSALREGDFIEESDRIIDRQINQLAMSQWTGYRKLDFSSVVLYDGTA